MSRPVAAGVAVFLLVASVAAGPVAGDQHSPRVQTPDGFDETTFRVTVHANGSATWAIEHRTPLENATDRDRFEAFATEFERNETRLYADFVEQAGLLTSYGTNVTGREMTARNFERSAATDPIQNTGAVRMSFRWSNFAVVDGDRVLVSDVFDGGFYVGSSQSIVFERGPMLTFTEARPTPDSTSDPGSLSESVSITYHGERSFDDRRPYVAYGTDDGGGAATTDVTDTPGAAGPGQEEEQGDRQVMALAVLLVVLGIGVGAALVWRSGAAAAVLETPGDDGGATTTGTESQEPSVPDEELLTDSDRVRKLLEENGGRMKQVDIVEETEWSKSKVSMLLSEMAEDGEISKLRVGRENIISLAGEEPDAAGSPFEDE